MADSGVSIGLDTSVHRSGHLNGKRTPRSLPRALEGRSQLAAGAQLVHFLTTGAFVGGSSSFSLRRGGGYVGEPPA